MHHRHALIGENGREQLEAIFKILQIGRLRPLDHRIHHIHLPACSKLRSQETKDRSHIVVEVVERLYGLTAGRQFVDDGNIQIAVQRHGQCTRYGGGTHNQNMGQSVEVLFPQAGSLLYAESVLLVYDCHSQTMKGHSLFQ